MAAIMVWCAISESICRSRWIRYAQARATTRARQAKMRRRSRRESLAAGGGKTVLDTRGDVEGSSPEL
jgi:hypothetical protein